MKVNSLKITSEHELPTAADWVIDQLGDTKIATFKGNLGAGKTTLIKSICKQLGSNDVVQSPTFSIINQYQSPKGNIYHIDAYRIQYIEEALDIGMEEYFYDGSYVFIEWPSKIDAILPDEIVNFEFLLEGTIRTIRRI